MSSTTNNILNGVLPVSVTPKTLEKKPSRIQSLIQIFDPSKVSALPIVDAVPISPPRATSPLDSVSLPSSSLSSTHSIGGEKPIKPIISKKETQVEDPELIEIFARIDTVKERILEEKNAEKGKVPFSVTLPILLLERAVETYFQVSPPVPHQEAQPSTLPLQEVKPVFDKTKKNHIEIRKIIEEELYLEEGEVFSGYNQTIIQKIAPQTIPLFKEIKTLNRKHRVLFKSASERARSSSSQVVVVDKKKEELEKISNDYELLRRLVKILSIYKQSLLIICDNIQLLDLKEGDFKGGLLSRIQSIIYKHELSNSYNQTFEEIAKDDLEAVVFLITEMIQDQIDRRVNDFQERLVENIRKRDSKNQPMSYEDLNEKLRVKLAETKMDNINDIERVFGKNSIVFLEKKRLSNEPPANGFQHLFNYLSLYFFGNPGVFYFLIENLSNLSNSMGDKRENAYRKLMSLSKPEKKTLKQIFDEKFNSDKENIAFDKVLTYLKISYNSLQQGVLYFLGATLLDMRQAKFNKESLGCTTPRLGVEDSKNEIHIFLNDNVGAEFHYLRKDGLLIADAVLHQEYTFRIGLPNSTQSFSPKIQAKLSFSCPQVSYDSNPELQDMVFDMGIIAKFLGLGELKIQLT